MKGWKLNELLKSGKTLLASSLNDFESKSLNIDGLGLHSDSVDIDEIKSRSNKVLKTDCIKEEYFDLNKENSADSLNNDDDLPIRPSSTAESKRSARMLAMARRKKKIQAKNGTKKPVDLSQSNVTRNMMANVEDTASPSPSPTTLTNPSLQITEQSDENKVMVESMVQPILEKHERISGLVWQFQGIYELLIENLLHEEWEVRHGAALGLRELMKKHAPAVGRIKGKNRKQNDIRNNQNLEDLATRLLTIFALDRFSDFVNDTAVAPVRESSAQTLATLIMHLNDDISLQIFKCLEQLVVQDPQLTGFPTKIWQATHGGLLGIRYFVSIKTDFLFKHDLLSNVVNIVLYGLNETDDDVQSVSAAILAPITADFVKLKRETLDLVLSTVWNSLTHLEDDLSSSVSSVMDLLAKLCQHEEILAVLKEKSISHPTEWSFKALVPRLYPFFRHSITIVRKSVLNLLSAFSSLNDASSKTWINGKLFKLLYQNILLEQNEEVLDLSCKIYSTMLEDYSTKTQEKSVDFILSKYLTSILHLLITPIGEQGKNYAMDTQHITKPSASYLINIERKRSSATANDESATNAYNNRVNIDSPMLAGDVTLIGSNVIYNTRVKGAQILGLTLSYFQESTLRSFFENVLISCLDLPYSTPRMLVAIVLSEYCINWKFNQGDKEIPSFVSELFSPIFLQHLTGFVELPVFRELTPILKALRTQCQSLMSTFIEVGMLTPQKIPPIAIIVKGEPEAGPEASF